MVESLVSIIRDRYERILEQVEIALGRTGRESRAVRVVVVTKSQPLEVVKAAIDAGIVRLGENYAEEGIAKIDALPETAVEWHMIGHVQSRKANLVAKYFTMMHSLDSIKLAQRIDQTCSKLDRNMPVLLEVNISGEESKSGFQATNEQQWFELLPVFEQLMELSHLQIKGLMTMPPFFNDPDRSRPFFKKMVELQAFLRSHLPSADWIELSMGTSVDFAAAVEEGATYVRVGQAILGPRPEKEER
jgi:PLP dependent protein